GSVLLAAGLVLLAVHRPGPESPPPRPHDLIVPAAVSDRVSDPRIGYLDTRDHRITLHGSGVYTIATKDGRVLAERVTLDQLQASNPQLHGILKQAVAEGRNNDARGIIGIPSHGLPTVSGR